MFRLSIKATILFFSIFVGVVLVVVGSFTSLAHAQYGFDIGSIQDSIQSAQDSAQEATQQAQEAAQEASEAAQRATRDAQDATQSAANAVDDAVSGLGDIDNPGTSRGQGEVDERFSPGSAVTGGESGGGGFASFLIIFVLILVGIFLYRKFVRRV